MLCNKRSHRNEKPAQDPTQPKIKIKNKSIKKIIVTKKKREKMQSTNIINEKGVINTNLLDVKRIIKGNYEQLYAHKFDNLDLID